MTDLITAEETIRVIEGEGRGCGPVMAVRLARVIFNLHAELATLKAQKWAVQHTDTINDIVSLGMERDRLAAELAQAKADAQVAVALVVERADIDAALDAMEANMRADGQTTIAWRTEMPPEDQDKLRACVRAGVVAALAPDAGVKDLAELRAERDAPLAAAEQQDALLSATPAIMQSVSAANAALEEKVRRLVEALEWYGENARLARLIHSEGDIGHAALANDGGKRAVSALAAMQPAEGEKG